MHLVNAAELTVGQVMFLGWRITTDPKSPFTANLLLLMTIERFRRNNIKIEDCMKTSLVVCNIFHLQRSTLAADRYVWCHTSY